LRTLCEFQYKKIAENTAWEPRQGACGKACLLVGAELKDSCREEFMWVSVRNCRTADTPESYLYSSGNADFKTILFFFLCLVLFGGRGEAKGVAPESMALCSWVLGSQ
jgi:hypothetical protein